jgi:hypothetical protein
MKEITSLDLGGAYLVRGFEKGIFEPLVLTVPSILVDPWSRSIVGIRGLQTLKI